MDFLTLEYTIRKLYELISGPVDDERKWNDNSFIRIYPQKGGYFNEITN